MAITLPHLCSMTSDVRVHCRPWQKPGARGSHLERSGREEKGWGGCLECYGCKSGQDGASRTLRGRRPHAGGEPITEHDKLVVKARINHAIDTKKDNIPLYQ